MDVKIVAGSESEPEHDSDDNGDDKDDDDGQDYTDDEGNEYPIDSELEHDVLRNNEDEPHVTEVFNSELHLKLQSPQMLGAIIVPIVASEGEILLMFLKYSTMEGLTHTAVTYLFQAINCMFVTPILPNIRYQIDKSFFCTEFVRYHAICPDCGKYVGIFVRSDREKQCPNCKMIIVLRDITFKTFYVTFNVRNEIKSLLESNDTYYNSIMHERTHESGQYKDIYDGRAYTDFVNS